MPSRSPSYVAMNDDDKETINMYKKHGILPTPYYKPKDLLVESESESERSPPSNSRTSSAQNVQSGFSSAIQVDLPLNAFNDGTHTKSEIFRRAPPSATAMYRPWRPYRRQVQHLKKTRSYSAPPILVTHRSPKRCTICFPSRHHHVARQEERYHSHRRLVQHMAKTKQGRPNFSHHTLQKPFAYMKTSPIYEEDHELNAKLSSLTFQ